MTHCGCGCLASCIVSVCVGRSTSVVLGLRLVEMFGLRASQKIQVGLLTERRWSLVGEQRREDVGIIDELRGLGVEGDLSFGADRQQESA